MLTVYTLVNSQNFLKYNTSKMFHPLKNTRTRVIDWLFGRFLVHFFGYSIQVNVDIEQMTVQFPCKCPLHAICGCVLSMFDSNFVIVMYVNSVVCVNVSHMYVHVLSVLIVLYNYVSIFHLKTQIDR